MNAMPIVDTNNDAASAARELRRLVARLRHETEAERRIARPIVERLIETRLWRMALPRELQGLELPIHETLEVYEELAGADASCSWVVWNTSLPCFFARCLEAAARAEVFAEPAWLYASSTRPTGTASLQGDGYRIDGRWALVSGCELAEWILLLCVVEEAGRPRVADTDEPELRFAYVRRRDCEILDTWHVGGLRGTGSHDVVVGGVCVPRRLTFAPGDPSTLDRPIARVPIIGTLVAGYAAQALGIARTCLDTVLELARTKVSPDPGPQPLDRPALQASIARGSAALQAARGHLRSCTRELWESAVVGAPPIEAVTAVWTAAHHATDAARTVVDAMYAAGGSSSLYTACPLERAHRDMHALLRHIIGQASWVEDAGRVMLGLPPRSPLYTL